MDHWGAKYAASGGSHRHRSKCVEEGEAKKRQSRAGRFKSSTCMPCSLFPKYSGRKALARRLRKTEIRLLASLGVKTDHPSSKSPLNSRD